MGYYLIRRFLLALLIMSVISGLSFVIIKAPPGDSVDVFIQKWEAAGNPLSEAEETQLRSTMGLDQGIHIQYGKWMGRLVRGDLGMTYIGQHMGSPVQERPLT